MRAKTMTLTLVAALAAMMTVTGCSHHDDTGRCVDGNGNILPNSACQGSGGYAGGGGGYGYPRRVYGGSVSGGRVTGYSSSPSDDGGISRGGFGGHGGGGE